MSGQAQEYHVLAVRPPCRLLRLQSANAKLPHVSHRHTSHSAQLHLNAIIIYMISTHWQQQNEL